MSNFASPKGSLVYVDTEEFAAKIRQALLSSLTHAGWMPWSTVDKMSTRQIVMGYLDRYYNPSFAVVHYACGGGEDQPPFEGWFFKYPGGDGFIEIPSRIKPLVWCYMPDYSYLDGFKVTFDPDEVTKYRTENP